ncbi:hypothetical protein ACJMK2_010467 [Sinanodonta woodiana]|uniref:RRM domain-containing protein n=1 Tax=Sinanodonta woodiana TaxID=1069815 RepID=A0ABD3VH14_SINWO
MADDFDVEAMLEAPYKKEDEGKRAESPDSRDKKSSKKDRDSDRDREKRRNKDHKERKRSHSRSRDRKRSKSKEKRRNGSRERREKRRSHSKDKHRSISKDRPKSRSRSREKREKKKSPFVGRWGSHSKSPPHRFRRSFSISPIRTSREAAPELTPEERDARTVFCMQLSARIRPRDLEEFFSSVGKVRDVRLITDNKTRRSKGIAYIEFQDTESVPLAMGLNNQKLLGVPIIIQPSQAEKNRMSNPTTLVTKGNTGPMRLYVGSLHFNITEDMLRGIFEPFGKVEDIKLIRDHETGRSQGYGFITFQNAEDAKKALEQLNGFELAGRPMKVGHVTERTMDAQGSSALDTDELDRAGIDLGATGRLQLMAKLAEGTGFQIPQYAANALNINPVAGTLGAQSSVVTSTAASSTSNAPPIATQCFMLSNMFDPTVESRSNWDQEIRDDVIEECNKHGGVLHIYVDKMSPQGNVYVKCPTIAAALASVSALHGRYFGGKIITAAYVPLPNYHGLFPEANRANQLLLPSTQALHVGYPPTSGMLNGLPASSVVR